MQLSVNPSRRTSPAPASVQQRFANTRSRMVHHALKEGPKRPDNLPLGRLSAEGGTEGPGTGDASPTSRIVSYGITMPRLRLAKKDIALTISKWYNTWQRRHEILSKSEGMCLQIHKSFL